MLCGTSCALNTLTGLVYHVLVTAPSQDPTFETSGRVNQKRRTRNAIVAAARGIIDRGESPTVAEAAAEALVSRTTAYRYFPTQESLLVELSVTMYVDEIEELLAQPLEGTEPDARMLEVVDVFNRHLLENEALWRTASRHYMDAWLAAYRAGNGPDTRLREGRRLRWISTILETLREQVPEPDLERLEAALCLVTGPEAITVLRDVCHLDPDQAVAVAHWAAQSLLNATRPT
jgi:AcrR family transcriptional regulator